MKETLVEISQQRMDKCQSEQLWALAANAAANAFVLTEKTVFAPHRDVVLLGLLIAAAATLTFVIQRLREYYRYRTDLARLVKDEPDAPDYMKAASSIWGLNSLIWFIVFAVVIGVPLGATYYCLQ